MLTIVECCPRQNCETNKIWNEDACKCLCLDHLSQDLCINYEKFNYKTCRCECPFIVEGPPNGCPQNTVWNHNLCGCEAPSETLTTTTETTTRRRTTTERTTTPNPKTDRLFVGNCMKHGDVLHSAHGCYYAIFQHDGNFVVYKSSGGPALWHTHTHGTGANRACMQTDGNFVIYAPDGHKWHTNTNGKPANFITVQDDGQMVVYHQNNADHYYVSGTVDRGCFDAKVG